MLEDAVDDDDLVDDDVGYCDLDDVDDYVNVDDNYSILDCVMAVLLL